MKLRAVTTPFIVPLEVLAHAHAHAATSDAAQRENPHFAAIGGVPALVQLVDRFYHHMTIVPEAASILALHPANLEPVKDILVRYLTEWTGGPRVYSLERGHPQLRHRHQRFRIGAAERAAWLTCMRAALTEIVPNPELRAELDTSFTKVANSILNAPEHTSHTSLRHSGNR
jgi:hemoglobin